MNIQRLTDTLPTAEPSLGKRHLKNFGSETTSLPATRRALVFAYAVISLSVLIFIAAIPFARVPLTKIVAFIPSYESVLVISNLITAILLFGRASQSRSSPYLALACGYLFCAAIIVPHLLTFPGVFSATGLLGANDQTALWLYVFWHVAFPIFVLAMYFSREKNGLMMSCTNTQFR